MSKLAGLFLLTAGMSLPTPAPAAPVQPAAAMPADPYAWLEEVTGAKPLEWVKQRNAEASAVLETHPQFGATTERLRAILDSKERIPFVEKMGERYYNFWRDENNERGLWRRTTLDEFRKASPAWETVLDLDALGKAENENWTWQGARCLEPDYRLCLVRLARGGSDASVVREFDLTTKSFVKDGFALPEAKSNVAWIDENTVFVGTDFGPGSLTDSGYPRVVKLWKRGTLLAKADLVFEGQPADMSVSGFKDLSPGYELEIINRRISFFSGEYYLRLGGKLVRLDIPLDADPAIHRGELFVVLRTDWTTGGLTYPAGALLASDLDAFLRGKRDFTVLYQPAARTSLDSFVPLKDVVLVNELDNVKSRVYVWERRGRAWSRRPLPGVPAFGNLSVSAVDEDTSNDFWLIATDYLTPTTLYLGSAGTGGAGTSKSASAGKSELQKLKSLPAFFKTDGLEIRQFEVASKDGTRIPYFQVAQKGLRLDGSRPVLLYGYGGFEAAMTPTYAPHVGAAWLERGNVYVVANIRGGGEFGPSWHQAALRDKRHRAYEDFIAVAEDLVRRKVTSPARLGIMGASNGGLLMGNMLTLRPDLFGAIVCQVPLLDMRRYHKLLAGASWMEEYGDPDDPKQWEFIRTFSPYHNLAPDKRYPRVLFTTSTRDDRVHPGHARKMVAKMKDLGYDLLYYENTEGGHAGAATNRQRAFLQALAFTYLQQQLEGT